MKFLFFLFFSLISFGQQLKYVDFTDLTAVLEPNAKSKSISGQVFYDFKVFNLIDTIKIDAKNMIITSVFLNGKKVRFKNTNRSLNLFEGYKIGKNKLTFQYTAIPKQALYFIGESENLQIWTQGQGKYTSNWLPSFDDVNEKLVFNLTIKYDSSFSCIANGKLKNRVLESGKTFHQFEMSKPMSSYLVMIAIGKFEKKKLKTGSGIPLELYIDKNDFSKLEPTYRYSEEVFTFLEKEIGFKYPWKIYKQVPIKDFLYAGMENTSATLFDQDFVTDSIGYNDKNYINVNAHELAHQWFGNLITAKSSKHHWLQEGFATYFALKAEREIFGDDYFFNKLYENAILLQKVSKTDTIPLLNSKASSLTFYQKGALALYSIENEIGSKNFRKIIQNFIRNNKFKSVETDDFLSEVVKITKFDVDKFKNSWLLDSKFDSEIITTIVSKSVFLQKFVAVKNASEKSFIEKELFFLEIFKLPYYYPIKVEILEQLEAIPYYDKKEIIQMAMQTHVLEVRQAVAKTQKNISGEFKEQYETLLNDKSYITNQEAFNTLWINFPEFRTDYMSKIKLWQNHNELNLRIFYLTYALLDSNRDLVTKNKLLNDLVEFTDPNYQSSIRQNAFDSLFAIDSQNKIGIKNLVNATTHFKWQFSKYARSKLKKLLESNEIRIIISNLKYSFSENEIIQINKLK